MDNKVLDEAVEVARLAYEVEVDGQVYSPNVPADAMRAALLAGVKVLLGEPVAWRHNTLHGWVVTKTKVNGSCEPLYAPSLGEGDGR